MATNNPAAPLKAERKTSISSVKSREQLLEIDSAYFAHEMLTMKQRRTKIIATLCDSVATADDIRSFLLSGMNIIRVNMAYCDQKILEVIMKNKSMIEKEQGCFIPIIMDLKGNTLRLGSFDIPGAEINLKKGDEFRITTNKKVKGNENIVSCDCSELGKILKSGDKLLVDYGRNVLVVKRIEKESETASYLRTKDPTKYDKGLVLKRLDLLKVSSHGDHPQTFSSSDAGDSDDSVRESGDEKDETPTGKASTPEPAEKVSTRRKFEYAFKKKKKVDKDVIVCEAEHDCTIQSSKPLFIHATNPSPSRAAKAKAYALYDDDSDVDDESTCISVKDIKDLNLALKYDIDSIAVTGVRSRKDIDDTRFIIGAKSHVRVIAKIQNAMALENFDEILEASDGIIISRNYLSLHIPIEKLFFKQKEMIRKCHAACKPVTIGSQVLESMVQGLVPTSSEINDIANLILDGIDCLTLVTETTYGLHKKESLETLSRIIYEVEYNEIITRQKQTNPPENLQQIPTPLSGKDIFAPRIGSPSPYIIPKINPSTLPSISSTIAACTIKAVYDLQASLVVAFTQTGSTVLKLSKLRSPCPIIAVTVSEKVARQVSLLASVTAVKVGSMFGKDGLTQKVLGIAKEKNWVKTGDYIVVSFGDIEGVAGSTNSLRIIRV